MELKEFISIVQNIEKFKNLRVSDQIEFLSFFFNKEWAATKKSLQARQIKHKSLFPITLTLEMVKKGELEGATASEIKFLIDFVLHEKRFGIGEKYFINLYPVWRVAYYNGYNIQELPKVSDPTSLRPGKPIPLALASSEIPCPDNWVKELKYDGERVQVHCFDKKIKLFSREGKDITHQYPEIDFYVENSILDGEIVAEKDGKFLSFQILMKRRRNEAYLGIPIVVYFFDIILYKGQNLREVPLSKRREILESLSISHKFKISERIDKTILESFHYAKKKGAEGLIIKDPDSRYTQGRSKSWVKKKTAGNRLEFTVQVMGYTQGKGKNAGFVFPEVGMLKDGKLVKICRVGTGFSDSDLKYLLENKEKKLLMDIAADSWTDEGKSLRFPVFLRFREDRETPDELY